MMTFASLLVDGVSYGMTLFLISVGSSPQEFNELIRKEMVRWSKVVKQAGVKLD